MMKKNLWKLAVLLTVWCAVPAYANDADDLHSVDVLKKHFVQPQEFQQWYRNLSQSDKNLVLAGAVYTCKPDMAQAAVDLGGDVRTKLYSFYITSGHDEESSDYIYTYDRDDSRSEDVFMAEVMREGMVRSAKAVKKESCGHTFSMMAPGTSGLMTLLSVGMQACQNPDKAAKMLKLLVNRGNDVNAVNEFHVSPLSEAIENGDVQTVQFLLQNGADFSKTYALSTMIDAYYDYRADEKTDAMVDFVIDYLQKNPLSAEAETDAYIKISVKNDERIKQKIAALHLQPDYGTEAAKRGLILAVDRWHYDLAKELIEHGVDINYQDKFGRSALFFVADQESPRQEDIEMVKFMLAHGADATLKNKKGETAFAHCAYTICKLNPSGMREMKLDDKAVVPSVSKAIDDSDCETITYFIKKGLDPYTDIYGTPLLFRLFRQEHKACLEQILQEGVDLNRQIVDYNGVVTPITYADRYFWSKWAVPLLQQYGAKELTPEEKQKIQDFHNLKERYLTALSSITRSISASEPKSNKNELIAIKKEIDKKLKANDILPWEKEAYQNFAKDLKNSIDHADNQFK